MGRMGRMQGRHWKIARPWCAGWLQFLVPALFSLRGQNIHPDQNHPDTRSRLVNAPKEGNKQGKAVS
eukprot:7846915-Pyramimonas_sp.AAC.1